MKPYLLLSCLLLSACVATPPWTQGGHIYEDYHAKKHYKKHYKGHCPPGLAKKHNGCMPPGQAKKWRRGYPLASDVIFHELSHRMARQLGRPPAGHRYVRVAQDILLIAVGTSMVVDAVYDLNHM
jgi:Ni/Co efflux regulator RcnB